MLEASALLAAHGLEFKCHAVGANPFMPQESSDLSHWLCSLSGGPLAGFEFYVSLGRDHAGEPEAALALSLVAADVRSYRGCEGYADFARLIGIEDDDPSGMPAWEEISRLAPAVEALFEGAPSSLPQPV